MPVRVRIKTFVTKDIEGALRDLSGPEHEVAKLAKRLADPYVPAKNGEMARNTTVSGNEITYFGKAVRILYRGEREGKKLIFSKRVHPMAQSHWFYGAKKDNMGRLRRTAAEAILKELGK